MTFSDSKSPKKLLIVTSSGGGGLIQTANAKEQEAKINDPQIVVIRKDVMKDWIWKILGWFFVNVWNQAQLNGNVAAQSFCVWAQFLVEFFLWPNLFFGMLITLFQDDIDEVIDTQPLGTSAMIRAIRIYNWWKNKNIRLEKVIVDLPTNQAVHFFNPIKKLAKSNRPFLKVTTIPPLLEEGQTEEDFWQTNCRLSAKDVNCGDVYVRQAFLKYQGKPRSQNPLSIKVHFNNEEEAQLMEHSFQKGAIRAKRHEHAFEFKIGAQDRMITILLGSQPANNATFKYVKQFLQIAKEFPNTPIHLFVFCANHTVGKESLFRKISDLIYTLPEYPKHFSIIPFSFQTEDVIAPLFYRSDLTCARSGGQTAMELMCVSRGEIWVHSEAQGHNPLTLDELLKGIPGWEAGSALYLQKIRGAKIVTPETFGSQARLLLGSNRESAHSSQPIGSTA